MPLRYPIWGPSVIGSELSRSTLELLAQPFAFSQSDLLTENQFIAEAGKRGLSLERGELEQLHRRGILVPFYRVHRRRLTPPHDRFPEQQIESVAWRIYLASTEGRLSDPSERPFRPWPNADAEAHFYYSSYQLLSLRALPLSLSRMKHRRVDNRVVWDLPPSTGWQLQRRGDDRAFAIVMEALSPRYRPRVTHVLRWSSKELTRHVDGHDPKSEEAFLSLDNELLLRQAEALLSDAHSFDPLGSWHRVARVGNPARWSELRNDALLAQDERIAAEILFQFLEDQASQGRSDAIGPPSPGWWEPKHERLTVTQRERAETVMDFHLSDRPAVYLALEGATEVTIVSKVLDLAGFEPLSSWIGVVDLDGVGGDVNLLARAVAVPRLDPDGHRGARVLSPLTALVVVADPEGRRYGTEAARINTLAAMKDSVIQSLPRVLQTDLMRNDLDYLIHLRVWDHEFEFAHFSNTELARAIRDAVGPTCPAQADLRRHLQQARARGGTIRHVWKNWPHQPSKIAMAEALWPNLEKRIMNRNGRRAVPVVAIVEEAIRISYQVRRPREVAVKP